MSGPEPHNHLCTGCGVEWICTDQRCRDFQADCMDCAMDSEGFDD